MIGGFKPNNIKQVHPTVSCSAIASESTRREQVCWKPVKLYKKDESIIKLMSSTALLSHIHGPTAFLCQNLPSSFCRESVLFIGTQYSDLYTAVDTPARGRVVVCLVFVCLVFVCKYVLGHSRDSQSLNFRLCLLRHLGFLTSPYASPTCRRRRLNSYRLLRRSTPGPPPIPWAHLLHLPASPRPPLYTSTMTTL